MCRGAVSKAMASLANEDHRHQERMPMLPNVISRVARLSYGICFFDAFDATIHNDLHKKWDAPTEKWIVNDLMHWYVKKVRKFNSISFHKSDQTRIG